MGRTKTRETVKIVKVPEKKAFQKVHGFARSHPSDMLYVNSLILKEFIQFGLALKQLGHTVLPSKISISAEEKILPHNSHFDVLIFLVSFCSISSLLNSLPQCLHTLASIFIISAHLGHFLLSKKLRLFSISFFFPTRLFSVYAHTAAATQPKKVQPAKRFNSLIEVALECFLQDATIDGAK